MLDDFILSTEILTEFDFVEPKKYKVRAVVFLVNSLKFENGFDKNLCGKSMKNWVFDALKPIETNFVSLNEKEDVFLKAKKCIKDEDFTLFLFSDTPLLTNNTINEIIDYVEVKNLDFCKLPRGFVVKGKNFLEDKIILSSEAGFVDSNEFFTVFDNVSLIKAINVLKNRILDRHIKNGVFIEDKNSVFIDYEVKIGKNVVIKQNNVLKGETIIKDNVVLNEFNKIEDSEINENCEIYFSSLKKATIKKNSKIGPFENIDSKK